MPYRWLVVALAALAAAVALAAGVHAYNIAQQDIGYRRAKQEYADKLAVAQAESLDRERKLTQQRDEAISHATERDQTIRSLASSSAAAADGLRRAIDATRARLPSDSPGAARYAADTFATLFDECQVRYRDVAEKADRHANDVQTLIAAWPKSP